MTNFGKRADGPSGRRGAERAPVLLRAAMHTTRDSRGTTLLDVSRTGAQMKMPMPLGIGQDLLLRVPPTEVFGTIVWIDGDMCGIEFDHPLDDQEWKLLCAKGKVVMIHGLTIDEQLGAEDWKTNLAR